MDIDNLINESIEFKNKIDKIISRLNTIKNDKRTLFNNEIFKGDFLYIDKRINTFIITENSTIIQCADSGVRLKKQGKNYEDVVIFIDKDCNAFFSRETIFDGLVTVNLDILDFTPFAGILSI